MINNLINCPACDDVFALPAIDVDQDCTSFDMFEGEVQYLYIRPTGAPDIFASWATTPTYVADSVDNSVADNTKTKWLSGIGSIPAPEKEVTAYPGLKTRVSKRTSTLTFRVLNMTDAQREFLRTLQCGNTDFTFYVGTVSDHVFGKAGGMVPKSSDANLPLESGAKQYGEIIITFEANADMQRRVNPHA
jgi:hypothetical protein